MTNYTNITISLYDPYPIKVLNIKQYDTGRGAMVTLTGLGGDVITPTGNGLYVYAKKRDGNIIYNTVTLVGSQVQIDFDEQMTVLSGLLQVEIQMIDPEGKTISTPIFAVNVMPSNINTLQIESTSEFGALTDALAEVENLKQNGLKGDPGEAATIQVGTVTASEPGGNPAVTNSGTENAAVLNFTLPRGEPGSMWYQGDAITGTSTSGTVFSGSGIASAEVNDMYLNTGSGADRGNVYVCTLAGNASTAQWAYKQNIMGPTGPAGTANASSVAYDNETSGLTADNVQEAVDELNQNMNVIGVLWDKQGNLTLSVANTFEKVMEISDLPAGTYIAIVRMQRNSASAPSTVMSWISVASNTESPSAGPSNGVTIPGGTSYPGTSLTRIIELTTSGSIGAWVQSTDISALFTGMMQVIRIK